MLLLLLLLLSDTAQARLHQNCRQCLKMIVCNDNLGSKDVITGEAMLPHGQPDSSPSAKPIPGTTQLLPHNI